ncbi:hypothetical protein JCM19240_697 [Vibrio maritimus]|uniref:Uncharacterized protein n=1 Tax=Vibrio maritimus TaxID=990268 RepID=A0A090TC95_9VIBR|nr:hypothetical protein JCM19240_697 [Vibrio maritimus]
MCSNSRKRVEEDYDEVFVVEHALEAIRELSQELDATATE